MQWERKCEASFLQRNCRLTSRSSNSTQGKVCSQNVQSQETQEVEFLDHFVETDRKVRLHTGLPSVAAFRNLLKWVTPRAKRMQYWHGKRKTVSTKVRRKFRTTPEKSGPKHKLSIQSELVLVLMKLRLDILLLYTCSNSNFFF